MSSYRSRTEASLKKQWAGIESQLIEKARDVCVDAMRGYMEEALKHVENSISYNRDTGNLDESLLGVVVFFDKQSGTHKVVSKKRPMGEAFRTYKARADVVVDTGYSTGFANISELIPSSSYIINITKGAIYSGKEMSDDALGFYLKSNALTYKSGAKIYSAGLIFMDMYYRYFLESRFIGGILDLEQFQMSYLRNNWKRALSKAKQIKMESFK